MFWFYTDTPAFYNDLCDEIRLFENVKRIEQATKEQTGEKVLRHFFWIEEHAWRSRAEYWESGACVAVTEKKAGIPDPQDVLLVKKMKKRLVKQTVYDLLKKKTGKVLPWGSLTGIRPTKMMREMVRESGMDAAREQFSAEFEVSKKKTALTAEIVHNQKPYVDDVDGEDIDVYIGIPFCVSRCKYCSFVSRDIRDSQALRDAYVPKLLEEMEGMRETLAARRVRSVYVGGGTPTALQATELERVLGKVAEMFPNVVEFTVEAGRPDTITAEKLHVIKNYGGARISINAQTTKQQTLELIGRNHTVKEFFDAYRLAREIGFEAINTDIILGLPEETLDDMKRTLLDVAQLEPENITVHTLALKNSSEFAREQKDNFHDARTVMEMVEYAQYFLSGAGYRPYYLYRQKYMSGNLENVGFAKPGFECVYNIDIMEEITSNIAFGAGAISKRVFGEKGRIERAPNVKDVAHYIERTAEMIARKKALFDIVK